MTPSKSVALIILDGWGENRNPQANAIAQAQLPFYWSLLEDHPHTLLSASGEDTGLPDNQMGNSEVGHMNIGAGRIVYQDLTRINRAIRDGSFGSNQVLQQVLRVTQSAGGRLHLLGLLSDGGVHSHIAHLYELLKMAKSAGVPVLVHAFLDGRDTPPQSGLGYLRDVEAKMQALKIGTIATVMGRYYAMDRDNRWDRVALAYRVMVDGEGERHVTATQAILQSYATKVTDEFVLPAIIQSSETSRANTLQDGDGVIFYNFRADRARELTRALTEPGFNCFSRDRMPKLSAFATLTCCIHPTLARRTPCLSRTNCSRTTLPMPRPSTVRFRCRHPRMWPSSPAWTPDWTSTDCWGSRTAKHTSSAMPAA